MPWQLIGTIRGAAGERGEHGIKGEDGHSVSIEDLRPLVAGAVTDAVAEAVAKIPPAKEGPAGKDGESIHPDTVARMIAEQVTAELSLRPAPKDGTPGKDADPVFIEKLVKAEVAVAYAALPKPRDGRDGKDADLVEVRQFIAEAVAAIPKPRDGVDGKDADMEAVRLMFKEAAEAEDRQFAEFANELLHGLEEDRIEFEARSPGVVVNVGGVETGAKRKADSDPVARVIAAGFADLKAQMSKPVKPVYDKQGKLVGGMRVDSLEAS